jgi:hypothetical protein
MSNRPPPLHATRAQGAAAIESPADYGDIASTAPYLTHLSLVLPAGARKMAGMLAACSKLQDLEIRSSVLPRYACLVDIAALAAGT